MPRIPYNAVTEFSGSEFAGECHMTVAGGLVTVDLLHDQDGDVWVNDGGTYNEGAHIVLPPPSTKFRVTPTGGATFNIFPRN